MGKTINISRRDIVLSSVAFVVAGMSSRLSAYAQDASAMPEKKNVSLGVGGKSLFYYLPLIIAERRGFFEEEGINATIVDFVGGSKSLQALVGGSLDVVAGAYEHTIRMQSKGLDIKAICELGRFPGICIGVRTDLLGEIKTIADLKGQNVGVTAPGSSTSLLLQYALIKNGLSASAASIISIGSGAGAVAAVKNKQVSAIVHVDPVITQLQVDGDIKLLLDTRTEEGTHNLFGGSNPAATVYVQQSFIDVNPVTTQRIVNAVLKALAWIHMASPDEVADAVPEEYLLGDRELYKTCFGKSRDMYSENGLIAEDGFKSLAEMLRTLDPQLAIAGIQFANTFDPHFVESASI